MKKILLTAWKFVFATSAVALVLAGMAAFFALFIWLIGFGPSEFWAAITKAIRVGFNHKWRLAEVLLVLGVVYLIVRKR